MKLALDLVQGRIRKTGGLLLSGEVMLSFFITMNKIARTVCLCFLLASSRNGFSRMLWDGGGESPAIKNGTRSHHLKRVDKNQLFQAAGVPKSHRRYYVVDLTVPTELGGSKDFSNLQLQSRPEAKAKNKVERFLLKQVRSGNISLTEAQKEVRDWKHVHLQ
jgi:hypothetical protein